jgi:hypothetical protein
MALNLSRRFNAPTQVCGQKGFRDGIEMQPVFWAYEPVPFVGVNDILILVANSWEGIPTGMSDLL